MPKVAVVLSGCGVFDGSEIHEAVSVLIHLSRHAADVECFAPDIQQPAVNHLTHKPEAQPRNVLVEAARIARGKIQPLSKLKTPDFDAVVFPGGFGAAKNSLRLRRQGRRVRREPGGRAGGEGVPRRRQGGGDVLHRPGHRRPRPRQGAPRARGSA